MTPNLSRAGSLPALARTVSVPTAVLTRPLVAPLKKPRILPPFLPCLASRAASMSPPPVWWAAAVSGPAMALSSSPCEALSGGSAPVERRWASVTETGSEGGGEEMRGGGGSGAWLASPRRRRVRVSWAFVGTPFRIVLLEDVSGCYFDPRNLVLY